MRIIHLLKLDAAPLDKYKRGDPAGLVGYQNVEFVTRTKDVVVVKVAGSSYFSSRGVRGYGPTEYHVYRLTGPWKYAFDERKIDGHYAAELLTQFPVRRPKK